MRADHDVAQYELNRLLALCDAATAHELPARHLDLADF
jgi:hypothetical protein